MANAVDAGTRRFFLWHRYEKNQEDASSNYSCEGDVDAWFS